MGYGIFAAAVQPPVTPAQPSSGISVWGVLLLLGAAAFAVWVRRSGKASGQAQPDTVRKRKSGEQTPSAPAAELPVVGMDALRENAPAWSLGKSASHSGETSPDKGPSLLSAPAGKLLAHKLDIPSSLAQRLGKEAWKSMCGNRGLAGLERGELEKTPYGVAVHVEFRGRLDFAAVQRGLGQIETGLDVQAGTLRLRKGSTAGRGIVDIRLRDPLADGVPWEAPAVPVRLAHPLRLAVTAFGDVVRLDVKQRIGIFGTSGSGKSCAQRLIGAHVGAAIDAELDVWDFKHGVEAQHYAGKARQVTSIDAAVSRLDWLVDSEFPRRAAKMTERGVSEWVETPWDPALVVMIDEGSVLVREFAQWQDEPEEDGQRGAKGRPLKRLFTAFEQGRALGVYFVWATQFPKSTNLPTEIRSQLNATVCMRMRTDGEARVVFGDDDVADGWAPQDLYGPGWLLVQDYDHTEPVDSKAVWLSPDTFRAVPVGRTSPDKDTLAVRTPGRTVYADSFIADRTGQDSQTDTGQDRDRTAGQGQDSGTGQGSVSFDVWLVLSVAADCPGVSEVARRAGRSKSAVHAALERMTEDGRVVQDGAGYRLRTFDRS